MENNNTTIQQQASSQIGPVIPSTLLPNSDSKSTSTTSRTTSEQPLGPLKLNLEKVS